MSGRKESAALGLQLHVRVTLMHYECRPLFRDSPRHRAAYEGDLLVREDRMHSYGRVVTVAKLLSRQDGTEVVVLQLNDAALLWIGNRKMRLRGFENVGDTEYGQVWEIEIL